MPVDITLQIPATLYILGCSLAALLLVIILLLIRITSKLGNMGFREDEWSPPIFSGQSKDSPAPSEVERRTHFDEFLNEDPERRVMSKKEQSEAFRKWRDLKGLNWSAPPGSS